MLEIVLGELAGHCFGFPVEVVEEILPAAQLAPLPGAPHAVEGVLDLRGDLVGVLDGRRRLGLPPRPVRLSDRFVVLRASDHRVAVRVDAVTDVGAAASATVAEAVRLAPDALEGMGLARMGDGVLLVVELETFLSGDEVLQLERALADLDQ